MYHSHANVVGDARKRLEAEAAASFAGSVPFDLLPECWCGVRDTHTHVVTELPSRAILAVYPGFDPT